ncbi:hypothetical protein [Candidatus Leptofilum sp.]|uniref:hypothetical protein n=1 Tax=Candidatus Leptofilum sp. TaxID=3241576 RepID=UPI003B59200D
MNKTMPVQVQPTMGNTVFFFLWIGVNIVGWAAWIGLATTPSIFTTSNLLTLLAFCILGGGLGGAQWALLRQRFPIIWYEWTTASLLGFGLGLYALLWAALRDRYLVFSPPGTPILEWDPLIGGALLGLALGCCQAIAWRPRQGRILVWIVVNVMAWSVGMFLPQLAAFLLRDVLAVSNTPLLSTLFPVFFAAAGTGLVLVWFSGEQNELDERA